MPRRRHRLAAEDANVLVLHGPNLNLLGEREPGIYGSTTLPRLDARLRREAQRLGLRLRIAQSNSEGALIDLLHRHRRWADGILINPAALTHYSYALRDAIAAVALPAVEVHLTDIAKREPFRRRSVIAPACVAQLKGKGVESYVEGLHALAEITRKRGS